MAVYTPINIENVRKGMVIKDRGRDKAETVYVRSVDASRCANHVHVNDNACYDVGTSVFQVTQGG